MAHQVKKNELAGFDLIGYRQPDGTILLGTVDQLLMDDFPEEAEINGQVYTLEETKKNGNGMLPASHKGHNIEWGIYV